MCGRCYRRRRLFPVTCKERAVAYVLVSPNKGGVASVPVNSKERGMASILVSPTKGGSCEF